MSAPVAVLVVPAERDPGGLLRNGRLPTDGLSDIGPVGMLRVAHPPSVWLGDPILSDALPLWWDGALVPEGWDRARRVLALRYGPVPGCAFYFCADANDATAVAVSLVACRLASRVVLLDRTADGRLIERAP